jgi:predicted TIM-barrel fold metal-dependent hydrolase
MELNDILAIDTMCRPIYCRPELAKSFFDHYEFKVMARGTFAGVMLRMGLKEGEEWKVFAGSGKASVKEMVAEMDELGVEYVFMDQMVMWSRRESSLVGHIPIETITEIVEESNGRVIGGAGYNPFRIKESLEEIERAVKDFGFKYVWFHPITFGLAPNDKKCYPLYAKCLELEIPVCYQSGHSAEPLPSEPGHPMYADEVALDFPELRLVLTHTGWPWVDEWISMLWRHPNVYGNIGAYYPRDLDPGQVRFMDGRGRGKVLWATNGFGFTRCKKEFLELPISDDTQRKVLRENAMKVFKL